MGVILSVPECERFGQERHVLKEDTSITVSMSREWRVRFRFPILDAISRRILSVVAKASVLVSQPHQHQVFSISPPPHNGAVLPIEP